MADNQATSGVDSFFLFFSSFLFFLFFGNSSSAFTITLVLRGAYRPANPNHHFRYALTARAESHSPCDTLQQALPYIRDKGCLLPIRELWSDRARTTQLRLRSILLMWLGPTSESHPWIVVRSGSQNGRGKTDLEVLGWARKLRNEQGVGVGEQSATTACTVTHGHGFTLPHRSRKSCLTLSPGSPTGCMHVFTPLMRDPSRQWIARKMKPAGAGQIP